ncbi:hypothetical protein DXG01_007537, partial [Tephrocybe rancida]
IEHAVGHVELIVNDDELNNIVSVRRQHIVVVVVDDKLIDAVIPQKGNIDGALEKDRIVAAIATLVGLNLFIDIEAEEDTWENADILDDTEGESEFNDFIDDREVAPDEEPPTAHSLIDEAENEVQGEEDEDLDDEEFSDNEYPPTAAMISHRALASHGDMEQWQSLLVRAYEQAREHQPEYQQPAPKCFDNGLKPLPPALLYRVRVKKFGDGLLYLVTHEFEPTVPTHEELALFQRCSFVDLNDIARTTNKMAALSLQVMDHVVVTLGKLITMTGTVLEFSGNDKEATICLDSTENTMDIVLSPSLLRKVVQVADRVRVVGGAGDGRVGWVVAVDGTELHVWEDKTALPFKVNVNRVAFHHDAQALAQVVSKQDVSWKPFEENPHPPPRRNLVYLGRHVMVIRRGVFKGYEGIIREILKDDEVHVELSATLKHETFHLSQLSNL